MELPPSANWYSSSAVDWSAEGLAAYAAKNAVKLFDPWKRKFRGSLIGHSDRVSSLSFSKMQGFRSTLATAAADGSIRIWDCETLACTHKLEKQHSKDVVGVALSSSVAGLVLSADKDGKVVLWNYLSDQVMKSHPLNTAATCVALSPSSSRPLAAVAFQTGVILILNISDLSVHQKLVGHEGDVHALDWESLPEGIGFETIQDRNSDPSAVATTRLASSGKDKSIRIWDVEKGSSVEVLRMPKGTQGPTTDSQKNRVWLTCRWSKKGLVTSGNNGDLWFWDLSSKKKSPTKLGGSKTHSRTVFALCFGGAEGKKDEVSEELRAGGLGLNDEFLLTISMDRQIGLWDLKSSKALWMLQGLGGYAYEADCCPADPHRVAVGVGDQTIRIWNTDNPSDPFDSTLLWKGLQGKITCVRWHPEDEDKLAFASDDGRVGIYDPSAFKVRMLEGRHSGTVYELGWRALSRSAAHMSGVQGFMLCSCGADGQILERACGVDEKEAEKLNLVLPEALGRRGKVSGFAFSLEGSFLSVGRADGEIDFFQIDHATRPGDSEHDGPAEAEGSDRVRSPHFRHFGTVRAHRQLVNRLRWHPRSISARQIESASPLKFQDYCASASDDGEVRVFDAAQRAGVREVCVLRGHQQAVTALDWCPNNPRWLASGSFDFTAQVWDVEEGQALYNLRGHEGRVFSVKWSLTDAESLFTTSDDQSVRLWKVTESINSTPPSRKQQDEKASMVMKQRKQAAKKKASGGDGAEGPRNRGTEGSKAVGEEAAISKESAASKSLSPPAPKPLASKPSVQGSPTDKSAPSGGGKKDTQSLLVSHAKAANAAAEGQQGIGAEALLRHLNSVPQPRNPSELSPLADVPLGTPSRGHKFDAVMTDADLINTIASATKQHLVSGQMEKAATLGLWSGNLSDVIMHAAENGSLTADLVALSPQAGVEVWAAASKLYARQLEEQGFYHKAVSYLLASNQVYEAVAVYRRAGMWRDALALARSRLGTGEEVVLSLWKEWGKSLLVSNRPLQSAQCFLRSGSVSDALSAIGRKSEAPWALASAHLAHQAGDPAAAQYASRAATILHRKGDLSEALVWYLRAGEKGRLSAMVLDTQLKLSSILSTKDFSEEGSPGQSTRAEEQPNGLETEGTNEEGSLAQAVESALPSALLAEELKVYRLCIGSWLKREVLAPQQLCPPERFMQVAESLGAEELSVPTSPGQNVEAEVAHRITRCVLKAVALDGPGAVAEAAGATRALSSAATRSHPVLRTSLLRALFPEGLTSLMRLAGLKSRNGASASSAALTLNLEALAAWIDFDFLQNVKLSSFSAADSQRVKELSNSLLNKALVVYQALENKLRKLKGLTLPPQDSWSQLPSVVSWNFNSAALQPLDNPRTRESRIEGMEGQLKELRGRCSDIHRPDPLACAAKLLRLARHAELRSQEAELLSFLSECLNSDLVPQDHEEFSFISEAVRV